MNKIKYIIPPPPPRYGDSINDLIKDWYMCMCDWTQTLNEAISQINEALEMIGGNENGDT